MSAQRSGGFSLIEVLVALIIIGVGMLGIAKLQAMAYSSTGTASLRSLAAIEAASLAASMRANRGYWNGTTLPTPLTFTVTGVSGSNPTMSMSDGTVTPSSPIICTWSAKPSACTPQQIAGYDLNVWANAVNTVLPLSTAQVSCPTPATITAVPQPVGCTIQLNWTEAQTGINSQSQGNSVATPTTGGLTNYTLYVEP